jgi:hypothetical protein
MRSLFGGLIRSSAGSALQGVGQQSDGRTISEYVPKGFDAERLGINSWDYKYRCDRSTRACRASGVDACRDLRHELLAQCCVGAYAWAPTRRLGVNDDDSRGALVPMRCG